VSLDKLIDGDWDFASDEPSPEEAILNPEGFEISELYRHISTLSDSEQALIKALFFKGMTERDYAKALGISKTALHARKVKVLGKLKIFLSEQ
jgi:DNA-directed RNA polymerase specialized sigma subunit